MPHLTLVFAFNPLYCTLLYCTALYSVLYSTLYSTLLYSTLYSTLLYFTLLYSVLYCTGGGLLIQLHALLLKLSISLSLLPPTSLSLSLSILLSLPLPIQPSITPLSLLQSASLRRNASSRMGIAWRRGWLRRVSGSNWWDHRATNLL